MTQITDQPPVPAWPMPARDLLPGDLPPAPGSPSAGISGEMISIFGALVGGVVGLLLPWVTIIAPFIGQVSRTGLDTDDGKIIGVALLVLATFALAEHRAPQKRIQVLLLLGFAGIALGVFVDYTEALGRIASVDNDFGSMEIGAGMYISGFSAAGGAIGAAMRLANRAN